MVDPHARHGRLQAPNVINRFGIGGYDKLTLDEDGPLGRPVQAASPGADKEANWLPAPKGRSSPACGSVRRASATIATSCISPRTRYRRFSAAGRCPGQSSAGLFFDRALGEPVDDMTLKQEDQ
ncbi:DUF1214 domain-containing protein [Kaistia sp. MMO-174]|uniref:DUF1214 domain-containing protein n=1 Tax=Kaistia sp. MMO-174 TaxID=3081256 RepID=UPI001ACA207A|nr:DUF1214 domain-containing protein [Hyphomicrobiales bacterium]